jgi:hypothetical protein
MTDDAPTLPLPSAGPALKVEPPPPRRTGFVAAFVILSVLVVGAVIVLVVVLTSRANPAAPVALNTSSVTPTGTSHPASPKPATVAPAATFTSLKTDEQEQDCLVGGSGEGNGKGNGHGHGRGPGKHSGVSPSIRVSWQTANASEVWIAPGTADAADSSGVQLPPDGNEGDFPSPVTFDCSKGSETFTITAVGADGAHVSRSWTVANPRLGRF